MKGIYETQGRAREYNQLASNLFTGCGHRCIYCYGAKVTHQDQKTWENEPAPRKGIIEQIQKDAKKQSDARDDRPILLCFITDPYQVIEAGLGLTRQTILTLHGHGLKVVILTKAGKLAQRDFDLLLPGRDAFATTLTLLDDEDSKIWEPNAGLPVERINNLKAAHDRGLETWVSYEPVIYPHATFELIKLTAPFVDHCKVGCLNYHPHAKTIDWPKFARDVKELLESLGKPYYLKKDLVKYL